MIDFTNCTINEFKTYRGANGGKASIIYNSQQYMVKFPPLSKRNINMSYVNSCISEYLGCSIFKSLGFNTQETLLGSYTNSKGKEKIVVACKDFENDGRNMQLREFSEIKNRTAIDSDDKGGSSTEVNEIIEAIQLQKLIPSKELNDFFWDMFIADAFIGNFDRHNGNWGVLVNESQQHAEIAPIYDCGSCLYPQLDKENMPAVLKSEDEINNRIFVFPTSAIQENNQKINYFDYISSLKNNDCNAALLRIAQRINMAEINKIIQDTPYINSTQKAFYGTMLAARKATIIDFSVKTLDKA